MDNNAPSDMELLDMAREVLSICSGHSLKEIIEDLAITRNSELTINRIFEGEFLRPLLHVQAADVTTGASPVLLSSDDENSDDDEFLRLMSGKVSRATDTKSAINSITPTATVATTDPDESHLTASNKTERPQPSALHSNYASITETEGFKGRQREYSFDITRRHAIDKQQDASPFIKHERHTAITRNPSPILKCELSPDTKRTSSPVRRRTPSPVLKQKQSPPFIAREPSPQDFNHGWDDIWEVENDSGTSFKQKSSSVRLNDSPKSSSPKVKTEQAPIKIEGDQDEQVIIDLHKTPTKDLKTATKFQLVSSLNQDVFSDWDYELISSPSNCKGSSTVMLTSPSSSRPESLGSGSESRQLPSSIINSTTQKKSTIKTTTAGTGTTVDSGLSKEQLSSSINRTTPLSKANSSEALTSPKPLLSPVTTYRSRIGSPTASDLMPSKTGLDSDTIKDTQDRVKLIGDYRVELFEKLSDIPGQWNNLVDTSLSPPRNPLDDTYDREMEELMNDMSWKGQSGKKKTNISRSNSSKNLAKVNYSDSRKGKKRASTSTEIDLEDWNSELGSSDSFGLSPLEQNDSPLSLQDEIVKRAKRRQKAKAQPNNGDCDPEDNSISDTAIEVERRKAEDAALKEAQKRAKEAEKQAKEAEKLAKRAAREEELRRKRELKDRERLSKEDEKEAEKRAQRELRIANRLTTKYEGVKEMIVCIEQSLYHSSFGLTLQDYIASIECQVRLLRATGAGGSTAELPPGTRMDDSIDSIPFKDLVYWRRVVDRRYDEENDAYVMLPEQEIVLEPFVLFYVTATDLARMIHDASLKSHLASIKRDIKLRKNKERLKLSSLPHHQNTHLIEDPGQRPRIIILISGVDNYYRELRKAITKKFQQAVLASLDNNSGQRQALSLNMAAAEKETVLEQERIEEEMLKLQLEHDCLVIQPADDEESAQYIVSLTEQIGLRPYKEARRTNLNVCVEGIRSGLDPSDTWIKSLQEIHMVTHLIAKSIAEEYPSVKSLYEGYRQAQGIYQAQTMLEDIPVIGRRSVVGRTISKRIYDVFMSEDPERPVV